MAADRSDRRAYFFRPGHSDVAGAAELLFSTGEAAVELRRKLGGKGASLHALSALGLNVPPGFTLDVRCSEAFFDAGETWPDRLREELATAVARLEEIAGRRLGDARDPLRVAVRSGAAESLPGMMDTVLDVSTLEGIGEAVERVFRSFHSDRARAYRREKAILGLRGTAVTVQAMCAAEISGVVFTRDPESSTPTVVVEAVSGLGEQLVSGRVTPDHYRLKRTGFEIVEERIEGAEPVIDADELRGLARACLAVEESLGRSLDIEWARRDGELYFLQARAVKTAPVAAGSAATGATVSSTFCRRAP